MSVEVSQSKASGQGRAGLYDGRMNRTWFALFAACAIALGLAMSLMTDLARATGVFFTIGWIILYARRLHDIGRSAWWILALAAAMAPVLIVFLTRGQTDVGVGMTALVQLGFTVVLGALPGDPGANRYGPPPGARAPS